MIYIKLFEEFNQLLYHGSDASDIQEFDLNRIGNRVSKLGFFFTSDPDFAAMFGEHISSHTVILSNPFEIDQTEWYEWRDISHGNNWFIKKRNELIKKGYDGIIIPKEGYLADTIIAFFPNQITNYNT